MTTLGVMSVHERPPWLSLLIKCLTGVQRGLTEYGRCSAGVPAQLDGLVGKSSDRPLSNPEEPAGHRPPDEVERALWSQLEDLGRKTW
jgi:hypothetical protein